VRKRVPVRDDAQERHHIDRRRGRGRKRQGDERVERVVTTTAHPLVFGERVLGHEHAREPGRLRGLGPSRRWRRR